MDKTSCVCQSLARAYADTLPFPIHQYRNNLDKCVPYAPIRSATRPATPAKTKPVSGIIKSAAFKPLTTGQ